MLRSEVEVLVKEGMKCILLQRKLPDAIVIDWEKRTIQALEIYMRYDDTLEGFDKIPYKELGYDGVILKSLGKRLGPNWKDKIKREAIEANRELILDLWNKGVSPRDIGQVLEHEKGLKVSWLTIRDALKSDLKNTEIPKEEWKRTQLKRFVNKEGLPKIHYVNPHATHRTACGRHIGENFDSSKEEVNCLRCLGLQW